jgi:hypothetical protein
MIQRRGGAGLGLEAGQEVGVRGDRGRQDLDREHAIEPGIAHAVDLTHPARPERGEDFIGAELRPD